MSDIGNEIDEVMRKAIDNIKDELIESAKLLLINSLDIMERQNNKINEQEDMIKQLLDGNERLLDALRQCRINHG